MLLPRRVIAAGEVSLGAFVVGHSGLAEALDGHQFTILDDEPSETEPTESGGGARGRAPDSLSISGWIDHPVDGQVERGGLVEVTGWVLPARAVDRVEVTIDDGDPEPARPFCVPRYDLVEHFDDPTAVLGGFSHLVDVGHLDTGRHCAVHVEAVGPGGRVVLGDREVEIGPVAREPDFEDRSWSAALASRADLAAMACVPSDGVNLVVVTHDLGRGGAQLWLHEILRVFLQDDQVQCTVIAPADGSLRAELESLGARVHLMGEFPWTAGAYESKIRELVQLVSSDGCNIALANTTAALIGVDLATRCGIPSVWAIHDHLTTNEFWSGACGRDTVDAHVRERGQSALRDASAVCFVSDATRRLYAPSPASPPDDRFVVVDYGVSLAEVEHRRTTLDRAALRAAHGFEPGDQVLLCTATVEPRKAQSNLVLAFARLAERHPEAQLVLVGATDAPYARATVRLADSLGLGRRVRMVPLTDDVGPWYVMADGFVLASDVESLPRSIIEAMAYDVPVVATDAGGVREIVRNGETGILCATRDVGALTAAIDQLLSLERGARTAMADRAASLVRSQRDMGGYTHAFADLLRGLAKEPGARPGLLLPPRPPPAT